MMRWKKIMATLLVFVTIWVLASCNIKEFKVSDSQIEKDISVLDAVVDGCVTATLLPKENYVIENYTITKRQTNPKNKEDLIYCDITISNSYIRTLIQYKLEYNFYDEGNWILDHSEILEFDSEPLAGADHTLTHISSVYSETGAPCRINPSLYSFSHQETDLNAQTCTLYYTCMSDNYSAKASCQLMWSQGNGWVPVTATEYSKDISICVYETDINWRNILVGTWNNDKERVYDETLTISSVDEKMNVTGTYTKFRNSNDIYSSARKGDLVWKVVFKASLDTSLGIIDASDSNEIYYDEGGKADKTDLKLYYNISTNEWELESVGMFGRENLKLYPSSNVDVL